MPALIFHLDELIRWQRQMSDHVMEMDDLTADVFDIITGVWLRNAKSSEALVAISADDFLRLRGLKKQKSGTGRRGGYKDEWRRNIARHISILASTWIRVFEMEVTRQFEGSRNKRVKWGGESRALVLTSREGQVTEEGMLDASQWRVRPGDVFAQYLFGPGRQTALISQYALSYDPVKQRWEKRLIRYLTWQWRVRQGRGEYLIPFQVSTLLKAAGVTVDTRNPGRTQTRLEKALDRLHDDGVIAGWQYVDLVEEESAGKKGGWRRWLTWKIQVEPPQAVMDQYAGIKPREPRKPSIPARGGIDPEQIKKLRLQNGLTQMQAAEEIGISQSLISQLERGSKPRLASGTVKKIRRWLERKAE